MTLKFQMEFRMGADGWSETLYNDGTVPSAADGIARLLVTSRLKCLTNQAQIHHYRISLVGGGVPSWRQPVLNPVGGWIARRDVGAVTTNCTVRTAAGLRRTLQLHGVPDDSHQYAADGSPFLLLDPRVDTYLKDLKAMNFAIRTVAVRAAEHRSPQIATITVANGVVTMTIPPTVVVPNQKVRVSGATGNKSRQWNAIWRVGTTNGNPATVLTFRTRRLIDPTATYDENSAQIRNADLLGYLYPVIASNDPTDSNGTRRTGRPTDSSAGKRSIKR